MRVKSELEVLEPGKVTFRILDLPDEGSYHWQSFCSASSKSEVLPDSYDERASLRINLQDSDTEMDSEDLQVQDGTAGCFPCRALFNKCRNVARGAHSSTRGFLKKHPSRKRCTRFLRLYGTTAGAGATGMAIGIDGGASAAAKLDEMATTMEQYYGLMESFASVQSSVGQVQSLVSHGTSVGVDMLASFGRLFLSGSQQTQIVQQVHVPATQLTQAGVVSVAAVLGICATVAVVL